MPIYNSHGLSYMISEYLKNNGVSSACVCGTQRGSHGTSFYADVNEMEKHILNSKLHETLTHNLYFSKTQYEGHYYCSCVKKKI